MQANIGPEPTFLQAAHGPDKHHITPAGIFDEERIMKEMQSWMRSLFGYKAKQASTSPSTPEVARNVPAWQVRISGEGVRTIWKVGDVILDQFQVKDIVGEGGMGTVYKIHYSPWGEDLAVKSPRPEIFAKEGGKNLFIREAETWIDLRAHPHLVTCYFVMILGGIPRIFCEYVDGGSLADWIRQRRLYENSPQQALERILDVSIQFAWGLHAAHEQGLVHQDVKPANVMLTSQGIAKVTDFGLAKARAMIEGQQRADDQTHQSILVSSRGMTPAYCSPEQAAGQNLNRKTDIWSWGVSVLEMFTGEVTWRGGIAAREVLKSYQGPYPGIPVMPAEVMKLLDGCFQQKPEARPATMLEVATELQAIYTHSVGQPYARKMPHFAETDAISFIRRAISTLRWSDPQSSATLVGRGISLAALGRLEEALAVFEQAIRLDPRSVSAYLNRGGMLRDLGRREEALETYKRVIRLNPNYPEAYNALGVVLLQLGRDEEALTAFEEATSLAPKYAGAYYNQGVVFQDRGRREEALEAYRRTIRFRPNDANAYQNIGAVLLQLGRVKEAEQALQKAQTLRSQFNYSNVADKQEKDKQDKRSIDGS